MELMATLAKRYPLAMAAYRRWLAAHETFQQYSRFVSCELMELPVDLLYGPVQLFFEHCGVVATTRATSHGRWRLEMHVKRITGRWDRVQPAKKSLDMQERMTTEISSGFQLIEARMRRIAVDPPQEKVEAVVVGMDVAEAVQRLSLQQ